jgi:hypothetical protein
LSSAATAQIAHKVSIPKHFTLALGSIHSFRTESSAADELTEHTIDILLRHSIVFFARLGARLEQSFAQLAGINLSAVVDVERRERREELVGRRKLG